MKVMIDIPEETYNKMRRGEALYPADANVAIFAIETGTPISESEDCVSFEAVKNTMLMVQRTAFISDNEFSRTLGLLAKLPPVTPAEKVGRWKRISMDKYVQHAMAFYKCSECGKDIIGEHNYCPNCGCRMQEVEE